MLIVAILSGLTLGNYLLYDSLNFTEQIEATSRYLEMSMKSHRGHRTTLSLILVSTLLRERCTYTAIVKDAEMQQRDAVRFASSFSRLLTAYILRTMLSEGKRIQFPPRESGARMKMVQEIELSAHRAYIVIRCVTTSNCYSTNLSDNSASRRAAAMVIPLAD